MARNNSAYPREFWLNIYKDYFDNKLTYSKISEKYGVSIGTISYRFKKDGYKSFQTANRESVKLENNTLHRRMYRRPIGPKYKLVGKKYILSRIKINKDSDCWEWTGTPTSAGYGQLRIDKEYWTSHRYSYTHFIGEIPEGLIIRHICHNPICCNPYHLKAGTHKENWNDSKNKHLIGISKRSTPVVILGIKYKSMREASRMLGLSYNGIKNHTKNGVLNIDSYRNSCIKANIIPKI